MYKYCLFIIILLFPIKSFCDGLVKKSDNNLLILNENNGKVIIQNIYSVDKNKGYYTNTNITIVRIHFICCRNYEYWQR